MPGLMMPPNGPMPAGAPQGPQGGPQGVMPGEGGAMPPPGMENGAGGQERRATEDEKGVYRQFVGNVVKTLYAEKTSDAIAETLRASQDVSPVEGLAQIVSSAVSRVAYSGIEKGLRIEREMALAATMQAVQDIGTNLSESVGAPPLNEEQMEMVYLRSIELIAERRDEHQRTNAAGAASKRNRPPDRGLPTERGRGAPMPQGGAPGGGMPMRGR